VYTEHLFDRFKFDNQTILNDEIQAKRFFENQSFIIDGYWLLIQNIDATQCEFSTETAFINAFDQPGAEDAVNFDCCAYYRMAELVRILKQWMHG
jgi:hypothetical protein